MDLAQYTRVVVSTGGGIVLKQENWGLLHHGVVFLPYINVSYHEIRLSRDPDQVKKRPLLQTTTTATDPQDAPLEKLKADVTVKIPPDLSPDQVADKTNPKAALSMSSEVDPTKKRGSVQYVALSDIQSGKVKLPQGPPPPGSLPSPGKGFAPIINTNTNSGDNELQ
eukprot:gene23735-30782_t